MSSVQNILTICRTENGYYVVIFGTSCDVNNTRMRVYKTPGDLLAFVHECVFRMERGEQIQCPDAHSN